ncbi:MAG TPA: hypothetical protein PKD63_11750 [Solirubrobacteraceae bacterium]|nr:hypothetical protein [Solirubrobacteraceae bacterium]
MTAPLDGIAGADALLGRPFPLPSAALPLARWVDVSPVGEGAEVVWSLDDSRPGAPGRLALYAGRAPAPPRAALDGAGERAVEVGGHPGRLREHPLADAQSSLRPVRELSWETGELALRLTALGRWQVDELLAIAASVSG